MVKRFVHLVLYCVLIGHACAWTLKLEWTLSPSSNASSYVLYCGTNSGRYHWQTNVGHCDVVTLTNVTAGHYFFVVTARDDLADIESLPSNEVNVCLDCKPEPATNLTATAIK